MKDWIATCAVGLVIIVGCAAGLGGTLAFLLAFGIAWYLFAARDLGFARARDTLGVKLLPPIWQRGNWLWVERLLDDGERLFKAASIALIVISLALMFWPDIVYGAALLIAAFYVSEILRGNPDPRPRLVHIPDAGLTTATASSPAALPPAACPTVRSVLPAPVTPARAPAPSSQRIGTIVEILERTRKLNVRSRAARKPVPLSQRRPSQRPVAAKHPSTAKPTPREKLKRPLRARFDLPSRKPDHPIATRPHKPRRPQTALRKPTMRKPVTPNGRGTSKRAAAVRH
ncbi:hypothetical protein [Rhodopseudomonas telluris]|uniref:Uncharacterized protein n=1 Tax=Rhodopseudomonas telluris TaxID=644215 RepID=A0ABV6ET72_9BRAD